MLRFIHAADLHLDAPFSGLSEYEGAPVERLRSATRTAFENLVQLAIRKKVHFVVIAGDLFDGRWTNVQTGLWTANQFRLLDKQGIHVYLIRGNHDALSEVPKRISWPDNVHEFPVDQPATMELTDLRVALHGQGFSAREVRDDVAATYPTPIAGAFNIGLLHTSLNGDARHDTYAPTSEQTLVNKGYQYWALGHIHQMREIRDVPRIAYSGCTQGRHIHEQGAKGCLLVEVDAGGVRTSFEPLDTLRWRQLEVDVGECEDLEELYGEVTRQLHESKAAAEGRYLAVRLTLTGMTSCHAALVRPTTAEEVLSELRNRGNEVGNIWIERVRVNTLPKANLDQLKEADDLLGELLRDFDHLLDHSSDDELRALAESLAPLQSKSATQLRESEIDLESADNLRRWLQQAERLLLTQLMQQADATDGQSS